MANIQTEKGIALEKENHILNEKQELPRVEAETGISKNTITTSVSSERQNIKAKPVQKMVSKRQYLSDGTPIPYTGERIFVIYKSKD